MRGAVWAALLVCVLNVDVDPVAAQTTGTPQAPTPPTPSSSGAVQGPAGRLDLSDKTRERSSPAVIAAPSVTGALRLPKGWSFRFESPPTCTGCPDRAGPLVTNANALWRTSGAVAWQVGAGAFGVRLTGQRGARLPLFMSPTGSATAVPMASDVIMSDPRTQWVVTLSAERTVSAFRGSMVSVFGDLFLPLASTRPSAIKDVRPPAQTAIVGGVRLRSRTPAP